MGNNSSSSLSSSQSGMPGASGDSQTLLKSKEVNTGTAPKEDPMKIESTLTTFPGAWSELHKAKEVFPIPFDGVRVTYNKGLSRYFQVTHNFTLGTMQPSGYKFASTYVGDKQLSQSESFPVMMGEMDLSGNLSAQILHAFTRNTRSRFIAQHQGGQFQAIEMGTDYRGPKTTFSITAANPDPLECSGIFVMHYLQAVTSRLALGAELFVHRAMSPQLGRLGRNVSNSLAVKYVAEKWQTGLQVNPMEMKVNLSYYHKVNDSQKFAVELEGKPGECVATLGYCFDIPSAECCIKAQIDTNYVVCTTLEKKLAPLPMSLCLAVHGNQKKAQYMAGIGLTVGG